MAKTVPARVPMPKKAARRDLPAAQKVRSRPVVAFSESDDEGDDKDDSVETLLNALLARKAQHAKRKDSARALANNALKDINEQVHRGGEQFRMFLSRGMELLSEFEHKRGNEQVKDEDDFILELQAADEKIAACKQALVQRQAELSSELMPSAQVASKMLRKLQPKRNRTLTDGTSDFIHGLELVAQGAMHAVETLRGSA